MALTPQELQAQLMGEELKAPRKISFADNPETFWGATIQTPDAPADQVIDVSPVELTSANQEIMAAEHAIQTAEDLGANVGNAKQALASAKQNMPANGLQPGAGRQLADAANAATDARREADAGTVQRAGAMVLGAVAMPAMLIGLGKQFGNDDGVQQEIKSIMNTPSGLGSGLWNTNADLSNRTFLVQDGNVPFNFGWMANPNAGLGGPQRGQGLGVFS